MSRIKVPRGQNDCRLFVDYFLLQKEKFRISETPRLICNHHCCDGMKYKIGHCMAYPRQATLKLAQ